MFRDAPPNNAETFHEEADGCRLEISQELRVKLPSQSKVTMRTAALVATGATGSVYVLLEQWREAP